MIMENKFREKLEPKIREKSVCLRTLTFTKLYFGQKVSAVSESAAWACCTVFSLSCPCSGHSPDLKDHWASGQAPICTSQPLGLRTAPYPGPSSVSAGSKEAWLREQRGEIGNNSMSLIQSLKTSPMEGDSQVQRCTSSCLLPSGITGENTPSQE